jgi:hypothetical protein
MRYYPNGVGSDGSDALDSTRQLLATSRVWFVNQSGGGEGADFHLLENAIAAASDGDLIVLSEGFTQTTSFTITVNKSVTIVGLGTAADGKPSVQLKNNSATQSLLDIVVSNVQIRNIYFPPQLQSCIGAKIGVSATSFSLVNCYLEFDGNDQQGVLEDNVGGGYYRGCTFVSTATSGSARPGYGLLTSDPYDSLRLDDCVFDDGVVGFSFSAFSTNGDLTNMRALGVSLLRGAKFDLSSATNNLSGIVQLAATTGGGEVIW